MDESDHMEGLGAFGEYGAVIVPPTGESGHWFVGLAGWDQDAEEYVAGTDGSLVETREEAIQTANRVLDWLAHQEGRGDLTRVWQQMHEQMGAETFEQKWPVDRGPWGRLPG